MTACPINQRDGVSCPRGCDDDECRAEATPTDAESGGAEDLVKRLRTKQKSSVNEYADWQTPYEPLWGEAANALEHITRALATAQERAEAAEREVEHHKTMIRRLSADNTALSRLRDAAERERDEAREALKPFAECCDSMENSYPEAKTWEGNIAAYTGMRAPTMGELRRARAALNGAKT